MQRTDDTPRAVPRAARRGWAVIVLAVLAGVALTAPSVTTGYAQDDHFFRAVFKGTGAEGGMQRGPAAVYTFSPGTPEANGALRASGVLPWWTPDGWRVNFLRPVASLSLYADFRLFGDRPLPMHLHSLVLYGLVIAAAGLLYHRLLAAAPGAAALATLLFALDAAHGTSVGWISHRNSLYALFFTLCTLLAHDQARHAWTGGRRGAGAAFAGLAWLLLAAGLLSAESGVAAAGYLFAYALALDPASRQGAPPWRALAALAGPAAVVLVWRVVYSALGYGAAESWFYLDPGAAPLRFLAQAAHYGPVLLAGLFAFPDPIFYTTWPAPGGAVHLAWAISLMLVVMLPAGVLLWRVRPARFFLVGALLATVPLCAAMPADRLLQQPSLGAMGAVALFVTGVYTRAGWAPPSGPARKACLALAAVFLLLHGLASPVSLLLNARSLNILESVEAAGRESVPEAAVRAGRVIVVVNTPLDLMGASYPIARAAEGLPPAAGWRVLYAGPHALTARRVDSRTLRVHAPRGFLSRPMTQVFRDPDAAPLSAGDTVAAPGMEVVVVEARDGIPLTVDFRLDRPLEDPGYCWLWWDHGAYAPFQPPAVGESVSVPGLDRATLKRIFLGPAPGGPDS